MLDVLQEVCRVPSVLTVFIGWAGLRIAGSNKKQHLCLSLISSSLQAQTVLDQFPSTHSSDPFAVAGQKQRNSPYLRLHKDLSERKFSSIKLQSNQFSRVHLFPRLTSSLVQPGEQELNQKTLFFHTCTSKDVTIFLSVTLYIPSSINAFWEHQERREQPGLVALQQCEQQAPEHQVSWLASGCVFPGCVHDAGIAPWKRTLPLALRRAIFRLVLQRYKTFPVWLKALIDCGDVSAWGMPVSILGQNWKMQGENSHWNQVEVTCFFKS